MSDRSRLSKTDKLCLIALAGIFLSVNLTVWIMDEAAYKTAEDKPTEVIVETDMPITYDDYLADHRPAVEAIKEAVESSQEPVEDDWHMEDVPLSRELQEALRDACEENGVPINIALGLIEVESDFKPDSVSAEGCYGLMQLNVKYFPAGLTPSENIRAGVNHLGGLLKRHNGDVPAALRAYNLGWDDGDRRYAQAVMDASEKYGEENKSG